MLHLLFRSTLTLSVLFTGIIGLIRARPYDGHALQAFFTSASCSRPCWQQIQPGSTTVTEALALLRADSWVEQVEHYDRWIRWSWSGQQPSLVNSAIPGALLIENQRVSLISVSLNVGFGDLQLTFGQPHVAGAGKFRDRVRIHFTYPEQQLTFVVQLACPMGPSAFWNNQPQVALNQRVLGGADYDNHLQFLKRC